MSESVDNSKIQSLQELMGDSFGKLIDTFITDTSNSLIKLRRELAAQNFSEVHRIAHSLKSSSANLGADRFSETARQLESEAKQADLSHADVHITMLESLFADISTTLKKLAS